MKTLQSVLYSLFILIAFTVNSQSTFSQDTAKAGEDDKISLRVARISYIEGTATVLRYTDEDWVNAEINMPLMAGDKVYAAPGGRLEIQLDDQTTVRLGSDTFVSFPYLDDAVGRINITKGKVNVNAAKVDYVRPPFEITTSNVMAVILEHATVRLDVKENGLTELHVRRGEVNVQKAENEFRKVVRGEKLIAPNPKAKDQTIVKWNQEDTFDQWSDVRDAVVAAVATDNYVTPRISGYNDLNQYGDWVETADYGRVWRPRVIAADWAPYREGRWVWREPYGWIWVSNEPWGWVPYHYGRWVHVRDYNWVWVPRETVVVKNYVHYHRPVWYPALVSFTYANHGRYFSFGVSSGYYDRPCVGWFPLGVHDYYHPWYDYDRVYISHHHYDYYPRRSFSISFGYYPRYRHHRYHHRYDYYDRHHHGDVTIIQNQNNYYENQNVDGAVTVVTQDDFENGNTSRRRRVTIARNAEPKIEVGSRAISQVPRLSERRTVSTRNELASKPAGVAGNSPSSRNNAVSSRTESQRNVDTRNERVTQPQRTTTSSASKDQQRKMENRTSSPSRGTSNRTGEVAPSAQNRTTSVDRPRSESRSNISYPSNTGRTSSNTTRPRSSVETRNNSSARSTSNSGLTQQNNTVQRSSVSSRSSRPTSSKNYLQNRYPNRTVTRPHAPVIEARQSRNTNTSSSRNSAVSNYNNRSRVSTSSNNSNSYNLRNQRSGTINLSPSRNSNTSNLPRVYAPESRNSSNNVRQYSNNLYNSQSRNSIPSYNSSSARNGNNFNSYVPQRSSSSSRSSSLSPSRSYDSSSSRSSSSSIQRNSISTPSSSSNSRSIQRRSISTPSRSSSSSSIQRNSSSSSSRSSGSVQRSSVSSPSRSSVSTSSSRSSSSTSSSSRSSSSRSPRR